MRLTCSQKKLVNALSIANKAVATNNTLPVLNNILIKAEGNCVYFTSTNLELAVQYFIEAEVKNEGKITLPSKLISSYVGYLKDGEVDIEVEEGVSVLVKSGKSKTKIKGISAEEFPTIPDVDKEGGFSVGIKEFSQAISQVIFAAALNTTRPILTGVYFYITEGQLKMVATDSYRLSERSLSVDDIHGEVSCIIPARTIVELGSMFSLVEGTERVEVSMSKNQVMFSVGKLQVVSRLIDGQFPNYKQVIPDSDGVVARMQVSDLSLVLKRIGLFSKENNNKVLLKVGQGKVVVTTEVTQYGVGEEELEASIEGGEGQIALNSQFILDALANLGDKEVVFGLIDSAKPAVLKSSSNKDYVHIIMPLKI